MIKKMREEHEVVEAERVKEHEAEIGRISRECDEKVEKLEKE